MRIDLITERTQLCILRRLRITRCRPFGFADIARISQREIERCPGDEEEIAADRNLCDFLPRSQPEFCLDIHELSAQFLVGKDTDRIIDIEHIIVRPCDYERAGGSGDERGCHADAERLTIKQAQDQVEHPGQRDSDDRDQDATCGQFALRGEFEHSRAQRHNQGVEHPKADNGQENHLVAHQRSLV